jgi:hypothetical protein
MPIALKKLPETKQKESISGSSLPLHCNFTAIEIEQRLMGFHIIELISSLQK